VLGSGVAWAELFQGGTNEETVVELFYKVQLTPCTSVQPDLQYIATPSGIHRDALAAGLRFQLSL
jgi:porin